MVSMFILLTGVLYGLIVTMFQLNAGGDIAGVPIAEIPQHILIFGNVAGGILVAVLAHVGITFIAWLMARAIGGPGLLVGIYRTTAYLLPFLWLALPLMARISTISDDPAATGGISPGVYAAGFLGLGLFLFGLYQIYMLTQGRGPQRSAAGVGLFVLFTGSVLYLTGI